jgi:hypothetical protein
MTDDIEASTAATRKYQFNVRDVHRTDYVIDAWGRSRDPCYNNKTTFSSTPDDAIVQ